MRAELALIAAGFDKLPTLSGNGNKLVSVNEAGTALVANDDITQVDFDTAGGTDAVARVLWNDTDGTLSVGLKGGNVALRLGQEEVLRVLNNTGSALSSGQVVYVSGASGQRPTVALAQANSEATSTKVVGIVTEPIANNQQGFVATAGLVRGLDTSAFAEGAVLWLSAATAGGITSTRPVAPNHGVLVGFCIRSNASDGIIYVMVQNGHEMDELHDVSITSVANNDILQWDSANGYWKNVASPVVSGSLTLSAGTDNGVAYLNASKVLTTGSALTFDGSIFSVAGEVRANATFRSSDGTNIGIFGSNVLASGVIGVTSSNAIPLAFGVGAVEQMRLTSNGLGIGTSSPGNYRLYVNGPVFGTAAFTSYIGDGLFGAGALPSVINTPGNSNQIRFGYYDNGANAYVPRIGFFQGAPSSATATNNSIGNEINGDFTIRVGAGNVETVRIDSSGNLGLRTVPSAWRSNTPAFQIGSSGVSLFSDSGVAAELGNNVFLNASSQYIYQRTDLASRYQQYQGQHRWFTAPSGTAGNAITFTQAMTLDASGNRQLGGTTSRNVAGYTFDSIIGNSSGAYTDYYAGATRVGSVGAEASLFGISTNGAVPLLFSTNNTERVRITSAGDFLVGRTNSTNVGSNTNTVAGTAIEPSGYAHIARASASSKLILQDTSNRSGTYVTFVSGSAITGSIDTNGTTTTYTTTSDARLKSNIAPAGEAGTLIDQIEVVQYDWTHNNAHEPFGLIAQDLNTIRPEAVVAGDTDEENIQKVWGVDYSKLVPLLIKEVQSLRTRIAALEAA
jgi:hypothetical protein